MKITIILGTRPEIIKMSPIIRECEKRNLNYFILHTGQHYSYEMDRIFFSDLELPDAKYNLDVGSGLHGEQTGRMLTGIESVLIKEQPDVVLVEGDTNTVLAGALAASKLHIKVGHVEAGLRSYDRSMPEEINRILTDHISDCLFAPTNISKQNLVQEGIPEEMIYVVGNTIVDATIQNIEIAKNKSAMLNHLDIKPNHYFLITLHRAENVDKKTRLKEILTSFELLSNEYELPLIFPIHPRTMKRIKEFNLESKLNIDLLNIIKPVGYLDFLILESNASLILTDSGGVQEEACILNTPCVTLRDNTERPETINVESNVIAGCNPAKILKSVEIMFNKEKSWTNPFGDGKSAEKITSILL